MEDQVQERWQQIHNSLRAFIAKRVVNEAEADDIVQDVWLKMRRGLDGLKNQRRLVSWVYQIARHAIIDHYRARGRQPELPAGLGSELEIFHAAALPAESSETSDELRAELAGCLRPMIEQLSKEYRQAVTLVDLEGLAQSEAAALLGLSVSGMKSRVQRGRRQLKGMLEACCTIELDRRRGVIDYEVRNQQAYTCRNLPEC